MRKYGMPYRGPRLNANGELINTLEEAVIELGTERDRLRRALEKAALFTANNAGECPHAMHRVEWERDERCHNCNLSHLTYAEYDKFVEECWLLYFMEGNDKIDIVYARGPDYKHIIKHGTFDGDDGVQVELKREVGAWDGIIIIKSEEDE